MQFLKDCRAYFRSLRRKRRYIVARFFLALGLILTSVFLGSESLDHIEENIFVRDIALQGQTYEAAIDRLDKASVHFLSQPFTFHYENDSATFTLDELGGFFDAYHTLEQVYRVENADSLGRRIQSMVLNEFDSNSIEPSISIHPEDFRLALISVFTGNFDLDRAYVDLLAVMRHEGDQVNLYPPQEEVLALASSQRVQLRPPFIFTYGEGEHRQDYILRFSRDDLDFSTPDEDGVYRTIQDQVVREFIESVIAPDLNVEGTDAVLKAFPEAESDYAVLEGIPVEGRRVLVDESVERFYKAIKWDLDEIDLVVETFGGQILNQTDQDFPDLILMAEGRSNFSGSPDGRAFNIRKGMDDKVNGIFVQPGEEYDFNANLGPVTYSAGWKESLAIFAGGELRPVPGGGLCQVATTVYRAAIHAGLPIMERSNHSLYVHYYKAYGEGLDAAIYPGVKNLRFQNDTEHPIFIHAYVEGEDAVVQLFGVPDGREVELFGPFYPGGDHGEFSDRVRLNSNQIGWWQTVRDSEGNVIKDGQLTASYRSIPY